MYRGVGAVLAWGSYSLSRVDVTWLLASDKDPGPYTRSNTSRLDSRYALLTVPVKDNARPDVNDSRHEWASLVPPMRRESTRERGKATEDCCILYLAESG